MRLARYLNEDENPFVKFEDPKIAREFDYRFLTLKRVPKELPYILKMLKKHLKKPLTSLVYKNTPARAEGGLNVASYSESMDGMTVNFTNIKKLKAGAGFKVADFQDQLKNNKESLEKWEAFQEKAITPKDKKKARGMVSRLSVNIHNLENKIRKGEVPIPYNSMSYAKNKEDAIESVVLHELGHREKHKADLFKLQVYMNNGDFPTEYSKRNISEYHSEVYALVKMRMIDKAPISDEAKAYFRKAIK